MRAAAGEATPPGGWATLFRSAFVDSRNPMALLDDQRRVLDVNGAYLRLVRRPRHDVVGWPVHRFLAHGAVLSEAAWSAALAARRVTGEAEVLGGDGTRTGVQWAASTEVVTVRRLVLVVVLSTSRWGPRFRREHHDGEPAAPLTPRERDVVRLITAGATGPEIADELRIADHTVRTHARNAMRKVGARSRAHLVAIALAEGHALA